jgi:hypothetical protein
MIAPAAQRWRSRRESYRPAGEPIATRLYEVAPILDDRTAKNFVVEHHYSGSFPAARWRVGLFRAGELVGVAVFSQPVRESVLELAPGAERVELGRLVLLDDVPANGESFFVARAFDLLRTEGVEGVVSFSDPMPRATSAGGVVFGGHVGTVYQALNATYLGQAGPRTLRLLPSGAVMSARAISKIRAGERGWRYAAELLVAAGASSPGTDLRAWLARELPKVTRTVRHPGNHRYVWALDRRLRRHLPETQPYPKLGAA